MQAFEDYNYNTELYPLLNWQPVKLEQHQYTVKLLSVSHFLVSVTHSTLLRQTVTNAVQQPAATVEAAADENTCQ